MKLRWPQLPWALPDPIRVIPRQNTTEVPVAYDGENLVRRDYSAKELRTLPDASKDALIELYQHERRAMIAVIERQILERWQAAQELELANRELARMREKE
jgi:hypothetical protein